MAKKSPQDQCTMNWLVVLSLVLIVLLILSILYQLAYPVRVSDTSEAFTHAARSELTYVYMDGCGHCREFDPTWREFVKTYRTALSDSGVSVRRIRNDNKDATDLARHGYPTVVLLSSSGDFAQTTFEGQRTVSGLANFVGNTIPSFHSNNE